MGNEQMALHDGDPQTKLTHLQDELTNLRAQLAQAREQQAQAAAEYARVVDVSYALQTIAAQLASTQDVNALLEGIVERTMAVLTADAITVWLLDEQTGNLHIAASRGLSATFLAARLPQPAPPTPETAPTFTTLRRERRPLYERDAPLATRDRAPALSEALAQEGIVSSLVLPLFAPGGEVAGMVVVDHRCERLYSPDEVRLAQAFADQIAVAFHNTRLIERERQARAEAARLAQEERATRATAARQLDRLTALTGITQQLLAATELETVLNVVVASATRLCEVDGGAVALIDAERQTIRRAAGIGALSRMFEQSPLGRPLEDLLTTTATGRAIAEHRTVVVEDYATWAPSPEWRTATLAAGIGSLIAAPLHVDGAVIGVLCVGDPTPRNFTPEDVALVQALADQSALAIEQARLLARSRDAAVLEERARLARDLHDSVTQSVFSAGMLVNAASMQYERGDSVLPTTLQRIRSVLGEALAEMRALLYELQPSALAEEGLAQALDRLARAVQVRTDMPVAVSGTLTQRLPAETETALFRIVQEALANATKYAQATAIQVNLTETDDRLHIVVQDDGAGFDPAAPVAPSADGRRGGMGLRSMRERAAGAGLALLIESRPGQGTRIVVEAPLPRTARAST